MFARRTLRKAGLAAITAAFWLASGTLARADIIGVASVIDADTIEIHGERIRLHGIDAPESCQTCEHASGRTWRCGQRAALALTPWDWRREHGSCGRHFAGLGNATVASSVLQTAINAYRHAGMPEESRRVRVLMEEKIRQAREEMAPISTEYTISREDIDKFCASIVIDDLASTFFRLAAAFVPKRNELEEQIEKMLKDTPLVALMPQQIMADNHVAANIGSVQDDPLGRLLQQATMDFGLSQIWLQEAINKLFETHDLVPDHFATWANRSDREAHRLTP
jgi:hypothetical protein